ncbi:MAG: hypothetical protein HY817_00130 [Candidatus Abawacabacteria bacterium]|nr:hypothetical protein [Candidatus Abawacabacteria bacterium]
MKNINTIEAIEVNAPDIDQLLEFVPIDLDLVDMLPPEGTAWVLSEFEAKQGVPLVVIYRNRLCLVSSGQITSLDNAIDKPPMTYAINALKGETVLVDRSAGIEYQQLVAAWHEKKALAEASRGANSTAVQRWLDARRETPARPATIAKTNIPKAIAPRSRLTASDIIRQARAKIIDAGINLVTEQQNPYLSPHGSIRCELRTFVGHCVLVVKTSNNLAWSYHGALANASNQFTTAITEILGTGALVAGRMKERAHGHESLYVERSSLTSSSVAMLAGYQNDPAREFGSLGEDFFDQLDAIVGWTIKPYLPAQHGTSPQSPYGRTYAVSLTNSLNPVTHSGYWDLAIFNRSR